MIHLLEGASLLLTWGQAFVFFSIVKCFVPLRQSRPVRAAAFVACIFLADCIVYSNDPASLLGPMAGFLVYLLLFYRGGWVEKLSTLLVLYPALISVNYLMMDTGSRLYFALLAAPYGQSLREPQRMLAGAALYALSKLLRLAFWAGLWRVMRRSLARIGGSLTPRMWGIVDVLMLASFVSIVTILCFMPERAVIAYPICGASLCSSFGCIYLAAAICDAMQAAHRAQQMEAQRDHYRGLLREEERVRSLYHDMKNHLLLLQAGEGEAARSLQRLQEQLEEYETYCQTGNPYLDVLLREKIRLAKDRQIDFQAQIDARDAGFLDPLDLSTIVGNALDNALEAAGKLPACRRVVTLRMARRRDMLVITVENTAPPGTAAGQGTGKGDTLLHGLGLPNIRRAAEKYGGVCSTRVEGDLFTLTVLLPIP